MKVELYIKEFWEYNDRIPIWKADGIADKYKDLPKMEADQKTSETAAGKACNAPHFPYFWVKGSTMVT